MTLASFNSSGEAPSKKHFLFNKIISGSTNSFEIFFKKPTGIPYTLLFFSFSIFFFTSDAVIELKKQKCVLSMR